MRPTCNSELEGNSLKVTQSRLMNEHALFIYEGAFVFEVL